MRQFSLIHADVLDGLRTLPDESVNCCVTSPPYWGLRDYKVIGQIGLEPTPEAYTERLVEVFREVRRVLRDDGTCWINLGDSYAGSWGNQGRKETRGSQRPINGPMIQDFGRESVHSANGNMRGSAVESGGDRLDSQAADGKYPAFASGTGSWVKAHPTLKPKDLVGIPWRVAFALQADGWWLRSDIIWAKPNPMPESVTDRPTKAHEYLFLLAKSGRYFYDTAAVSEPTKADSIARYERGRSDDHKWADGGPGNQTIAKSFAHMRSGNKERRFDTPTRPNNHLGTGVPWEDAGTGRNRRTVWTIATEPFPEAHFATFPTALVEPCILAGCPVGGTVLDPFSGSGTTGVVALRHERNYIGIELNAEYAAMGRRRIFNDAPLLNTEATA